MEKNPKFEDFGLNVNNTNDLRFMMMIKFYIETRRGYNNGKPYNKN